MNINHYNYNTFPWIQSNPATSLSTLDLPCIFSRSIIFCKKIPLLLQLNQYYHTQNVMNKYEKDPWDLDWLPSNSMSSSPTISPPCIICTKNKSLISSNFMLWTRENGQQSFLLLSFVVRRVRFFG